jgi:peptidoglycan/LPS O-acetylase OafA/YrhL
LVLFFHTGFGFSGGYVGVDVFFVISGFLITGLILKRQETGVFQFSSFWLSRIRRIVPACTFVVIATMGAAYFILLPDDYEELAKSAIAQQLMVSNFFFWRNTGYFNGAAELKPLLHLWSLAIEEQFYLAYPFLLMFLRRFSLRTAFTTLAVLTCLSLGLSEWMVHFKERLAFFLLPTRAWELLLGGLLCYTPKSFKLKPWDSLLLSWVGIGSIFAAAALFDSTTRFPGAIALLPCAGAAAVILANSADLSWVGRVLATKPFVYVGSISYSLYLWHWPILALIRHHFSNEILSIQCRAGGLVASTMLAILNLHLIETPIRKKVILTQTRRLLIASFAVTSLIFAVSLYIIIDKGLPTRFDPRVFSYAAAKNSSGFIRQVTPEQANRGDFPTFGASHGKLTCLIWGDSHAMALVPGLDAVCKDRGISGFQATHSATAPILDFSRMEKNGLQERTDEFNRAVIKFAKSKKVDIIILSAFWNRYIDVTAFERQLIRTMKELNDSGIRVAIVRDVAEQNGDVPLQLSKAVRLGQDVSRIGVSLKAHSERVHRSEEVLLRLAQKGLILMDPSPYFVDEHGLWRAEIEGQAMYRDGDHLSVEGSLRLTRMFDDFFANLKN